MAIRLGRWDCTHCAFTGNSGPAKHCVNCGSPRAADVQFYLPKDAEIVSDQEQLEQAFNGPDWNCNFCAGPNVHFAKFCAACGGKKSGSFLEEKTYLHTEAPLSTQKETTEDHVEAYNKEHGINKKKSFFTKLKLGVLAVIAAIGGWLGSFSSTVTVEVNSLPWERSVVLERYQEVEEKGWTLPSGARSISSEEAVHHEDKVFDGYETKTKMVKVKVGTEKYNCGKKDLGNGYFEDIYCDRPVYEERKETYKEKKYKKVPVYQTEYTYAVFKWVKVETLKTSGNDRPAQWPLSKKVEDFPNEYRLGKKKQQYWLEFERKGKVHREEASFSYWDKLEMGQSLKAEISTVFRHYKGLKEKPR